MPTPARPICPGCGTRIGQRFMRFPTGKPGHTACVNAYRAKHAKPEPQHDRRAELLARQRGDVL